MFAAFWNRFYNNVIRNVSPYLKGAIILGLVGVGLLCIITSMRKGHKDSMTGSWFLLIFGICLIILAVVYAVLAG